MGLQEVLAVQVLLVQVEALVHQVLQGVLAQVGHQEVLGQQVHQVLVVVLVLVE